MVELNDSISDKAIFSRMSFNQNISTNKQQTF